MAPMAATEQPGAESPPQAPQDNIKEYNAPKLNLSLSDFDIVRRLGEGSFSTVLLAWHRGVGRYVAVKMISKTLVLRQRVQQYIRNERDILDRLKHPGIAQLLCTFQDNDSLYMVLEYCPNGELYEQLHSHGKLGQGQPLPLASVRQYAAEVVDILGYLRQVEVIHRDLKPENLLLDGEGHVKLIDFGSAKPLFLPPTARASGNRLTSFVGTAEYVSPEVLSNQGITYASDLWALGCIIFQLLTGDPPFRAASEYLTFQRISARDLSFPDSFPADARDLVDHLLQMDPLQRLGAHDLQDLQAHPFFQGISWADVRAAPAPPFAPPPAQPMPGGEELDWELHSMAAAQPALRYEYLPPGAKA